MGRTNSAHPLRLFSLGALGYAAIAVLLVRSQVYASHPDVLAWGLTFDLAISIPLIYWFVIVRTGLARPMTLIPLFVVAVAIASRIVPHGQHRFVEQLGYVAAPLDLVTLGMIARRLIRLRRNAADDGDVPARIERITRQIFGNGVVAGFVALEVSALYYGFFCWKKPAAPGFSVYRRSGWDTVLVCILVLLTAESIGVHLFIQMWSARAAWVMTILDLYGAIWFIGDYHALRLRPITIDENTLHVRFGFRWSVSIPLRTIAAVEPVRAESEWKRKGVLKVAMLDEPRLLVRLTAPATAIGLAGIRKTIDAVAILPDDLEAFEETLRAAMAALGRPAATV
jgi:hypothetical protein